MKKSEITFEERLRIQKMLKDKVSFSLIAKLLNKCKKTIIIEVGRHGGVDNYDPHEAQKHVSSLNKNPLTNRLTDQEKQIIKNMRKEGNSCLKIALFLKRNEITIFRYLQKISNTPETKELQFDFNESNEKPQVLEEENENHFENENEEEFDEEAKSKRITFEDRKEIERLYNQGHSLSSIARILGFGKNTIIVEFRKYNENNQYYAKVAQKKSDETKINKYRSVAKTLKEAGISPFKSLVNKISCLEMQVEILFDEIKKLRG